jgi:ribonuclease Y
MEAVLIVAALLVGAALGAAVCFTVVRATLGKQAEADRIEAGRVLEDAKRDADAARKEAEIAAKERMIGLRSEVEQELKERRIEVARAEERVDARERDIEQKGAELKRREQGLDDREAHVRQLQEESKKAKEEELQTLQRIAGMTQGQARDLLLRQTEEETRHDMAKLIRQIEEEAKQEADRRVRNIISIGIQRTAASHAAETTVSMVELPSDDLKGRIIGREGRNIRALENLTGVDVIIDDTPQAVVLSGFDGVRREIARLTIAKLVADGRIHPSRIEETYYQAKAEIEDEIIRAGEQASFEADVPGLHGELIKLLGRLKFRTSYGQNVLRHSLEVTHLAAIMAAELGASEKTARRAALLHDIGKAVSHEVEGSHAVVGAQLTRKFRESNAVAHAIEAHHFDVEPQTVEAVLVQAADAISAARPGARGESMEHYIKRLEALERIATSKAGVDKCYAMQAGREVRVIVKPSEIDDDAATLLSRQIAREIEDNLEYPGQIKITVIRESRATEYAK